MDTTQPSIEGLWSQRPSRSGHSGRALAPVCWVGHEPREGLQPRALFCICLHSLSLQPQLEQSSHGSGTCLNLPCPPAHCGTQGHGLRAASAGISRLPVGCGQLPWTQAPEARRGTHRESNCPDWFSTATHACAGTAQRTKLLLQPFGSCPGFTVRASSRADLWQWLARASFPWVSLLPCSSLSSLCSALPVSPYPGC